MAFDCVIVDFKNKDSEKNKATILQKFPHAETIPFISSYFDVINSVLPNSRTTYQWLLSSKVDYTDFDFDYIPEQHEKTQLHTWGNKDQSEGDTFLFPSCFLDQKLKFLRDYKDVNYHRYDGTYDFDFYELEYDLSNVISNIPKIPAHSSRYVKYYNKNTNDQFYPSYWEDLKIYKDQTTFYIPLKAVEHIKTQIYDYPLLYTINEQSEKDCFDIAFISNGEPFEDDNFKILEDHIKKNKLNNKLNWIKGVDGRTRAYKKAAMECTAASVAQRCAEWNAQAQV